MPTDPLSTIGLPMPDDFPFVPYEAVHSRIGSLQSTYPDAWPEYSAGWNAVGWRFYACAEYDESFTRSLREHERFPPMPERYAQERDLYGFFISELSVIESFCYGMYAMAAMVRSDRFPIATEDNERHVNYAMVAAKFASVFPSEPVTRELRTLIRDPNFDKLKIARNMLAHRASPARHHSVSHTVEEETTFGPSLWGALRLNAHVTRDSRRWLARALSSLLSGADSFTSTQAF